MLFIYPYFEYSNLWVTKANNANFQQTDTKLKGEVQALYRSIEGLKHI